ncbi:MAG: cupin domain-containing protein [Bacteroidia bacterium]
MTEKTEGKQWKPGAPESGFWHSGPEQTGAQHLVMIEVVIEPGKGHCFQFHPHQEKIIYVVEGKIRQWLEKTSIELSAGESAFIPKGVIHATFNVYEKPARFIAVLSPCAGEKGYEIVDVSEQPEWKNLVK